MKGTIDLSTCPLLSLRDMGELFRNLDLAKRAIRAGWIKPCVRTAESNRGISLFARRDVDAVLARIIGGDLPPPLPRNRGEAS